jgi:hypothetical protein
MSARTRSKKFFLAIDAGLSCHPIERPTRLLEIAGQALIDEDRMREPFASTSFHDFLIFLFAIEGRHDCGRFDQGHYHR